jgi:hypothetical protein
MNASRTKAPTDLSKLSANQLEVLAIEVADNPDEFARVDEARKLVAFEDRRQVAIRLRGDRDVKAKQKALWERTMLENRDVALAFGPAITDKAKKIAEHTAAIVELYPAALADIERARSAVNFIAGKSSDWPDCAWSLKHHLLNDLAAKLPIPFSYDGTRANLETAMANSAASLENEVNTLMRRAGLDDA